MSRDDDSASAAAIAAARRDNIDTLNIADDRLNGAQKIADFRGEAIHRLRAYGAKANGTSAANRRSGIIT